MRISLLGDPVPEVAAAYDILQATRLPGSPAGTDCLPHLWPA